MEAVASTPWAPYGLLYGATVVAPCLCGFEQMTQPPKGTALYMLLWTTFRSAVSAGVVTALVVVAFRPPKDVWIATWVILVLLLVPLDMRQSAPGWFRWFRGRLSRRKQQPSCNASDED